MNNSEYFYRKALYYLCKPQKIITEEAVEAKRIPRVGSYEVLAGERFSWSLFCTLLVELDLYLYFYLGHTTTKGARDTVWGIKFPPWFKPPEEPFPATPEIWVLLGGRGPVWTHPDELCTSQPVKAVLKAKLQSVSDSWGF